MAGVSPGVLTPSQTLDRSPCAAGLWLFFCLSGDSNIYCVYWTPAPAEGLISPAAGLRLVFGLSGDSNIYCVFLVTKGWKTRGRCPLDPRSCGGPFFACGGLSHLPPIQLFSNSVSYELSSTWAWVEAGWSFYSESLSPRGGKLGGAAPWTPAPAEGLFACGGFYLLPACTCYFLSLLGS